MVLGIWDMKHTVREMKTGRFYKDVLCEFFLTFMLMFAVMMSAIGFPERPTNVYVANIIGCYVMALIEGWAHVQLCVMNPNFCFMFLLNKSMSLPKSVLYCLAELAAAACGALMIYNITPESARATVRPPGARDEISVAGNWVAECIAVAYLVSVVLGSGDGDRKRVMLPNLAIGFAVLSVCVVGAPWGVNLNPAVAFGFCLVTGGWDRFWLYCTAGASGVIIALLVYHFLAYDKGAFGNSAVHDRFPEITRTISRAISRRSSRVDVSQDVSMQSVTEIIDRENERQRNIETYQNAMHNGYHMNQSTSDVRL